MVARGLLIAAAFSCAGIVTSGSAYAAPDVTGAYIAQDSSAAGGLDTNVWTVSACGADCVDQVSTSGKNRHFLFSDAENVWVSNVFDGSAMCPDGGWIAVEMVTTVDSAFTMATNSPVSGECYDGTPARSLPSSMMTLTPI